MGTEALSKLLQAAEESCGHLIDANKEMPGPFEQLIRHCEGIIQNEEVRKEKQLIGMREAQRKGIHIGHPAIPISKKFLKLELLKLERLYSEKVISAKEAAEGLNIAVSTFYKLRKKYRKEIEEWKT